MISVNFNNQSDTIFKESTAIEVRMKKLEIIASLGLIVFSIIILLTSNKIPLPKGDDVGAAFFPRILAIILIILSFLLLFNAIRRPKDVEELETRDSDSFRSIIKISIVIVLTVVYRYTIEYIGFLIITPIYLIILMFIIKVEKISVSVIVSISTTLIIWFAFYYFLEMPLPMGILFK